MPIKNIIVYSNKLPPEHVGGVESNAWHFIRHLAGNCDFGLAVVSQKRKTPRRLLFFKRYRHDIDYDGIKVPTFYQQKKALQDYRQTLKLLRMTGFQPEETLIFHNTLDLHRHFHALKDEGYTQVARSGGNDIFYMQSGSTCDQAFVAALGSLDRFFVNSVYSRSRSREIGVPEHLLEVNVGGCELPDSPPVAERAEEEPPIIVTCGRLVDFKGLEDAFAALARLKQSGIRFRFLIVGDGELRQSLERLAQQLEIATECQFVGKVSPSRVVEFYRQADLYLSTSKGVYRERDGRRYLHTETMGRSLCEAQANGVPVVATNAGGVSEVVVHGETGIVVNEGDVGQIGAALTRLLSDRELRLAMAQNASRHAAKTLSWEAVFARYEQAIREFGTP